MSPSECYNYFINDFKYEWYDLEPLHKVLNEDQIFIRDITSIDQESQYLYNIECLVFEMIDTISR